MFAGKLLGQRAVLCNGVVKDLQNVMLGAVSGIVEEPDIGWVWMRSDMSPLFAD